KRQLFCQSQRPSSPGPAFSSRGCQTTQRIYVEDQQEERVGHGNRLEEHGGPTEQEAGRQPLSSALQCTIGIEGLEVRPDAQDQAEHTWEIGLSRQPDHNLGPQRMDTEK